MKECNSKQALLDSLMKKVHSLQSQLQPSEVQTFESVHMKPLEAELLDLRESESFQYCLISRIPETKLFF